MRRALLEGTIHWLAGLAVLAMLLPEGWSSTKPLPDPGDGGLFDGDFGRRWGGGCAGWDNDLAIVHVVAELLHFWGYLTIGFVLVRLHPILRPVRSSWWAIHGAFLVFIGCGWTHALSAYAVFNPVYRATGAFGVLNGVVSCLAAIFIAHALSTAFRFAKVRQAKADAYRAQLERRLKQRDAEGG